MGFFRTLNKAKGFLNKAISKTTGFGGKVLTNSSVSTTQVNYLSNVTSDIQTKINFKQGLFLNNFF